MRQTLNGSLPEVPSGVMDQVLGQWQQMSTSVAKETSSTESVSNASSVPKSANAVNPGVRESTRWIQIAGKSMGIPQTIAVIGATSLVVGAVLFAIGFFEKDSATAISSAKTENPMETHADNNSGVVARGSTSDEPSASAKNNGLANKLGVESNIQSATDLTPHKSTTGKDLPAYSNNGNAEENGLKTAANHSTANWTAAVGSNSPKSLAGAPSNSNNVVAILPVEVLPDGWVQVAVGSLESDKLYLDWGDGKLEKVREDKPWVKHQFLPYSRKKFRVQVVEMSSQDSKNRMVVSSADIWISPVQLEEKIPDIVTVNGDGYNDEFYVLIPEPEYFEMLIFDKRNSVVFRSTDPHARWAARNKDWTVMEGEYRVLLTLKYSGEESHRFIRRRLIVQQ